MEYAAALGTPVERFSELQQCYRQTNLCFSRRYSVERNQILEEETPGETAAEVLEDVKLGGAEYLQPEPAAGGGFSVHGH